MEQKCVNPKTVLEKRWIRNLTGVFGENKVKTKKEVHKNESFLLFN